MKKVRALFMASVLFSALPLMTSANDDTPPDLKNGHKKQSTAIFEYVFTDENNSLASVTGGLNTKTEDGYDSINASAVSLACTINLNSGTTSSIAGKTLTLSGTFEKALGGNGNDTLIGNEFSNDLDGGPGNDSLDGGDGADFLDGGTGDDILTGGADHDMFVIYRDPGSADSITDFNPALATEKIIFVGFESIEDFSSLAISSSGDNSLIRLGEGQTLTLKNVQPSALSEQNFMFITKTALNSPNFDLATFKFLLGERSVAYGDDNVQQFIIPASGPSSVNYFARGGNDGIAHSGERSILDGGNGDDLIFANYNAPKSGFNWIEGGAGADEIHAGGFSDVVSGGSGNDSIYGEDGDDSLHGDSGQDAIFGGDGNDILIGGSGNDYLSGDAGNDTLMLEGDIGMVTATSTAYFGNRLGGAGADVYRVTASGGGQAGVGFDAKTGEVSASNLIIDFNVSEPGEMIDLTDHPWIRSMNALKITSQSLGDVLLTTVTAENGLKLVIINLVGISPSQLDSSHFRFAGTADLTAINIKPTP